MKKWISFLIFPWILTFIVGFIVDLIIGHAVSMNVFCAILGVIYGMLVFAFAPHKSFLLITIWLIVACLLDISVTNGEADNPFGSPSTQNLIKGIASLITAWLCLMGHQEPEPFEKLGQHED